MSSMERNKGILKYVGIDTENFTEEDFETYRENSYFVLDNEIYEVVEWQVKRETDSHGFCEIISNPDDNTYSFHTYHYNGGASLEEVLQGGW